MSDSPVELPFEEGPERDGEAAFCVDVDGFEGPLDLLLELARRQKVDLHRISVLALAEQYLAFIEAARARAEGRSGPSNPWTSTQKAASPSLSGPSSKGNSTWANHSLTPRLSGRGENFDPISRQSQAVLRPLPRLPQDRDPPPRPATGPSRRERGSAPAPPAKVRLQPCWRLRRDRRCNAGQGRCRRQKPRPRAPPTSLAGPASTGRRSAKDQQMR